MTLPPVDRVVVTTVVDNSVDVLRPDMACTLTGPKLAVRRAGVLAEVRRPSSRWSASAARSCGSGSRSSPVGGWSGWS